MEPEQLDFMKEQIDSLESHEQLIKLMEIIYNSYPHFFEFNDSVCKSIHFSFSNILTI